MATIRLVPSEPDEAKRWALLDAPQWTSKEALELIQRHDPVLDILHHWISRDVDDGFVQRGAISNFQIALDCLDAPEADILIDSWDVTTKMEIPWGYGDMGDVVLTKASTEAIVRFVERYPKSTWSTGRPPQLRSADAGPWRALFVADCIRELHRRGMDVDKYNSPVYATPIRSIACAYTRHHVYVSYSGKTIMHM